MLEIAEKESETSEEVHEVIALALDELEDVAVQAWFTDTHIRTVLGQST